MHSSAWMQGIYNSNRGRQKIENPLCQLFRSNFSFFLFITTASLLQLWEINLMSPSSLLWDANAIVIGSASEPYISLYWLIFIFMIWYQIKQMRSTPMILKEQEIISFNSMVSKH